MITTTTTTKVCELQWECVQQVCASRTGNNNLWIVVGQSVSQRAASVVVVWPTTTFLSFTRRTTRPPSPWRQRATIYRGCFSTTGASQGCGRWARSRAPMLIIGVTSGWKYTICPPVSTTVIQSVDDWPETALYLRCSTETEPNPVSARRFHVCVRIERGVLRDSTCIFCTEREFCVIRRVYFAPRGSFA